MCTIVNDHVKSSMIFVSVSGVETFSAVCMDQLVQFGGFIDLIMPHYTTYYDPPYLCHAVSDVNT